MTPAQKKALIAALISALAILGITVPASTPSDPPVPPTPPVASSTTPAPPPTTTPPAADGCVQPAGMTGLRSQDPSDEQNPWRRPPGQKAVINVDTSALAGRPDAARWLEYLNGAAKKWNVSPCIDMRIVSSCPSGATCGKFEVVTKGDDGNFDEVTKGGFSIGGRITVNSKLAGAPIVGKDGREQCSEQYNVVIHELGHLSGLRHVTVHKSIMDPETYPDVCTVDQLALDNLAYSYTALQKR